MFWCFQPWFHVIGVLKKWKIPRKIFQNAEDQMLFSCFQLWFHEKNSSKNPWKYWSLVLFGCFQLWFHEKKSSKNPGKYWNSVLFSVLVFSLLISREQFHEKSVKILKFTTALMFLTLISREKNKNYYFEKVIYFDDTRKLQQIQIHVCQLILKWTRSINWQWLMYLWMSEG